MAETKKSGGVGRGGGGEGGASSSTPSVASSVRSQWAGGDGGGVGARDVKRFLRIWRKACEDGGKPAAAQAALLVAAHMHAGSGARADERVLQRCIRETNEPRTAAAEACAGGRVPIGVHPSTAARILAGVAAAQKAAKARAHTGASNKGEDGTAASGGRRRSARVRGEAPSETARAGTADDASGGAGRAPQHARASTGAAGDVGAGNQATRPDQFSSRLIS